MLFDRYINALVGYFIFTLSRRTTEFIHDRISTVEDMMIPFGLFDEEETKEERFI